MEPIARFFLWLWMAQKTRIQLILEVEPRCSRNLTVDCKFHRSSVFLFSKSKLGSCRKASKNKLLKATAQRCSPHVKQDRKRAHVRPYNTKTLMAKQAEKQELDRSTSSRSALEATAAFHLRLWSTFTELAPQKKVSKLLFFRKLVFKTLLQPKICQTALHQHSTLLCVCDAI